MKKLSLVLLFLSTGLIINSCTSTRNIITPKQTFTYDYKTPKIVKAGSSKMLVAFIKPSYAESFRSLGNSNELFKRFRDVIGDDIEELLVDKGFRVKGNFNSFDEMIFEARKETDLAISIEIVPSFSAPDGGWHMKTKLLSVMAGAPEDEWWYSGTVSLIGKINLSGYEPLTHEKIWSKSVTIPSIENISVTTARRYPYRLNSVGILSDENVYNAMGKALQEQYNGIMGKIDTYIEPEELNSLKKDIQELKTKKGYQ